MGDAAHETQEVYVEVFIRKTFEENPRKGCEMLFRLYYRGLCTHAVRYVYSKEIAEDLVADVFYTFWNTRAFLSVTYSFRSFLFRSVRNRAYNYLMNEMKKTDDGIILVHVMKDNLVNRLPLKQAISEGIYGRIRPVIMIALLGSLGLLPAALSNGMGSEIQKTLAIMIVGGLLICMFLSFTVLPQIFYLAYRKSKKEKSS
ncbi:hypothetical protein E0F88_28005 [Dyadobacter psychrotolerans]|uniref:RNA polymerase sigma-70 region 2 domain-containing protein n=2 Tax=Dyadobacter psychrotolerans TaxID=2541721 RepID=A0A4R5DF63_9BACT|nr:hypothetical protein E0F88_28005 [Dyadobacter psychrotolerans]